MTTELQPITEQPVTDFRPRSFQEALKFCEFISKSELVPVAYRGKPADIFTAMQAGAEIGFSPIQSLQSLIVIQGRPSMYSDAMLALVQASNKMEWIKEWAEGDTAICETKRLGYPAAYRVVFSQTDAQRMGLDKKPGAWTQTPGRMRQHRARAFNLRDQYADVLRGMGITEEVDDVETAKHTTQALLSQEKGDAVLAKIEQAHLVPRQDEAPGRLPEPVPDATPMSAASTQPTTPVVLTPHEWVEADEWVEAIDYLAADPNRNDVLKAVLLEEHARSCALLHVARRSAFLRRVITVCEQQKIPCRPLP